MQTWWRHQLLLFTAPSSRLHSRNVRDLQLWLYIQMSRDAVLSTELLTLSVRTLFNLYCDGGIVTKGEMVIIIIIIYIVCILPARFSLAVIQRVNILRLHKHDISFKTFCQLRMWECTFLNANKTLGQFILKISNTVSFLLFQLMHFSTH